MRRWRSSTWRCALRICQGMLLIVAWSFLHGINGYRGPFHCHSMKATDAAVPTTNVAITWAEFQEYSFPPQVNPRITTVIPAKARNMPRKSTAFSFLFITSVGTLPSPKGTHSLQSPSTFFNGMKNNTQRVVNRVSGSCILKIHRQESSELDESAPPMTGPMPFARATTAPLEYC